MARSTEVLVVGAGPGGYVAAIKLGKLGKKTLLVDSDTKLGGECLNYGCIPSKALIHAAQTAYKARQAVGLADGAGMTLDWGKVQAWKNGVVSSLNRGISMLERGNGVEVAFGRLRFTGDHEAVIASSTGEETVSFESAIIATGTRPSQLPGFETDGDIITSKEALDLSPAPARMLVIGAGVIGLEIGTFLAKLGTQVTVVEIGSQILPGVESDLSAPVARKLEKMGVAVWLNAKAKSCQKRPGDGLSVKVQAGEEERELEVDKILVCVGRSPQTGELGLAAAGVKTDGKGHVVVDGEGRASAEHIFAIGDVVGPPYLAHKASREGILAALRIAGKPAEELGAVPWAVFTDPEIAFVGESEAEARSRGASIMTGRFPFSASGRAMAVRDTDGFVKVIADRQSHKILGCGIVGPAASDLIGEACLAVRLGARLEDAASTIHPHPTLNEAFMEACEAALGEAIHIMAPPAPRTA